MTDVDWIMRGVGWMKKSVGWNMKRKSLERLDRNKRMDINWFEGSLRIRIIYQPHNIAVTSKYKHPPPSSSFTNT